MDGINEETKPITEKINFQLLITTVVFMVIGFIYFIQKLRRLFQPFNFDNNNVNNNFNNNANINQNNINSNANQNMQIFISILISNYIYCRLLLEITLIKIYQVDRYIFIYSLKLFNYLRQILINFFLLLIIKLFF